jgi:hypothetical protein
MSNYERTQAFCSTHLASGGDEMFIEALRLVPETTIIHVRPKENEYDASYWAQNKLAFDRDGWLPGHPNHVLKAGLI